MLRKLSIIGTFAAILMIPSEYSTLKTDLLCYDLKPNIQVLVCRGPSSPLPPARLVDLA
jgi:hypothetical protein